MSIYRPKGSPYWHYDFRHRGQRFYGSTGCTARRAAEAYEARVRHEALTATPGPPPITLDDAAGLYAARVEARPSWPNTRRNLAVIIAALGARTLLSEVTQAQLVRLVARRRAGRKDSSVNREIEDWRAMWRWAERHGHAIGRMPDWRALLLPTEAMPPRELRPEEETALFANLRPDLHPLARFALASGWRLSEIIRLTWANCDLANRQAKVRVKGGRTLQRPLSARMVAIISSQSKAGPQVFTYIAQASRTTHAAKDGRKRTARRVGERYPLSTSGWRKPWAAALKAAGIDAFRFHDLRHTMATRLLRHSRNLALTKEALAHTQITTTLRYAHVLNEDVIEAIDAQDAADSRNSPEAPTATTRKA